MQQILSNTTKIIVDQKGGNNLLYLPLDKLMQMTATQGPQVSAQGSDVPLPRMATPAEPTAAAPAPAAAADTRSRDALRSRER
jgi:membrane protease subunit HflK